ncbi:MAG TPA: hypothetical protein VEB42_04010, partial [Chitinophagaceae bacterium]|nr:hypothetical protein [Chitinophagaceae bacterium]
HTEFLWVSTKAKITMPHGISAPLVIYTPPGHLYFGPSRQDPLQKHLFRRNSIRTFLVLNYGVYTVFLS